MSGCEINVAHKDARHSRQKIGDEIIVGVECLCLRSIQPGEKPEPVDEQEVFGGIAYCG